MIIEIKFRKGASVGHKRAALFLRAAIALGVHKMDTRDMLYQVSKRMTTLRLSGSLGVIAFESN